MVTPVVVLALLLGAVWAFADIPSIEELENPDSKLATQVIAEEGEILTTYHIENRTFVGYEELPQSLVQAAVATEDKRFYKHSGIDIQSLGRVFFRTLLSRDSSQGGGSTITQQLAKTLYPRGAHVGGLGMVWIKLKEWITAIKLERNYTKDEIMDMYMNAVFFGSNSYGISSAANQFFGKQPSELLTEESAVLVGMVNKPTRYNPALNPDHALRRRNLVLSRMEEMHYLTKAECDSLQALPITLHTRTGDRTTGVGPYFRDMLRRIMGATKPRRSDYTLVEDYRVDSLQWADDPVYGWLNKNFKSDGSAYDLDKDGLRIYTTINYKMQRYAEEAVAEHLGKDLQKAFFRELKNRRNAPFTSDTDPSIIETTLKQARRWSDRTRMMKASGSSQAEIDKSFSQPMKMRVFTWDKPGYRDTVMTPDDSIRYYKSMLRTAFVAMEPGTGHVKAYVGGPNYRYFKYDNVRQGKRQVGSTIKPFLYTLAMQEGMTPCDKVVDLPQTFEIPGGDTWTPRSTDSEKWIGKTVTLKWGLTNSSNNISAYLMKQFGPEAMADMMRRMGIQSHIDEVPALCVGPADITLWEMVAAYNTFPSKGVYVAPLYVTRIEDSQGNVITEFTGKKKEAIGENTAFLMVNLMEGVVQGGTASRLRYRYNLMGEIAGKTGTTNDNSDGWFIGYTPTLVAGVWTGAEDRQVHFQSGALGQGANMSLPTWGIFMKKVLADGTLGVTANDRFIAPAGVVDGLGCTGSDDEVTAEQSKIEDYYFE